VQNRLRGDSTRHGIKSDFAHAVGLSAHNAVVSRYRRPGYFFAVYGFPMVDRVRKIALTRCAGFDRRAKAIFAHPTTAAAKTINEPRRA